MSVRMLVFMTLLWLGLIILSFFVNAGEMFVIDPDDKMVPVGVFCETKTGSTDLDNGQIRFFTRSRVYGVQADKTGWAVIGTEPATIGSALGQERYPGAKTLIGTLCVMWASPKTWGSGHRYFRAIHFKESIGEAGLQNLTVDPYLQDGRHTVHKYAMSGTLLHDYGVWEYLIKNNDGDPPGSPLIIIE